MDGGEVLDGLSVRRLSRSCMLERGAKFDTHSSPMSMYMAPYNISHMASMSWMIVELETTSDSDVFDREKQMIYEPKYVLAGASYK